MMKRTFLWSLLNLAIAVSIVSGPKAMAQDPQLVLRETGSGRNTVLVLRRDEPGSTAFQAVVLALDPTGSVFHLDVGGNFNSRTRIHLGDLNKPHNTVTMLGKVGIGTTDPGSFQLAVNGAIRSKEVVVETGWSDFVFEEGYSLRGLPELKAYIETHGHLPDVPSAAEVAAHGVSLGEMQARLLQKVEELTLHLIATNERLEALERENGRLHETIEASEAAR